MPTPTSPSRRRVFAARAARQHPTDAEELVWQLVRNRGVAGLKFRRQHVLHGFVVDFYCAELRLVLELDGGIHDDPHIAHYDRLRSEHLLRRGLRIMRIRNEVCLAPRGTELVRLAIAQFAARNLTPRPLHFVEREPGYAYLAPPLHEHGEGDGG